MAGPVLLAGILRQFWTESLPLWLIQVTGVTITIVLVLTFYRLYFVDVRWGLPNRGFGAKVSKCVLLITSGLIVVLILLLFSSYE